MAAGAEGTEGVAAELSQQALRSAMKQGIYSSDPAETPSDMPTRDSGVMWGRGGALAWMTADT